MGSLQAFMIFVHYLAYRKFAQPKEQSPTHSYTVHLSVMLSQKAWLDQNVICSFNHAEGTRKCTPKSPVTSKYKQNKNGDNISITYFCVCEQLLLGDNSEADCKCFSLPHFPQVMQQQNCNLYLALTLFLLGSPSLCHVSDTSAIFKYSATYFGCWVSTCVITDMILALIILKNGPSIPISAPVNSF